jgi:hypothetical protein
VNGIRYTERQHNTPEQIREYLREALDVVDELDPPDDLRVSAFVKAAELAAAKQVTGEAIMPAGHLLQPRL